MRSKTAFVIAAFSALLAAGSIAIGMCRLKLGQPHVVPFVIGFFVFLALAILFAELEKRKRYEE